MKVLLFLISMVISTVVFAGSDHSHGHSHGHSHSHSKKMVKAEQTQQLARVEIERLIKSKKLDASWSSALYEKSIKKSFHKKNEWVVTFTNEKGVKAKKLYIFLKLTGEFVAANFSGK